MVMQKEGRVEGDGGQPAVTNSHRKKKFLILQKDCSVACLLIFECIFQLTESSLRKKMTGPDFFL